MNQKDIVDDAAAFAVRATLERLSPGFSPLLRMLVVLEFHPVVHAAIEAAIIQKQRHTVTLQKN
jgi:hypothetical protein